MAHFDVLLPRDAWTVGLPPESRDRMPGRRRLVVDDAVLETQSFGETPEVFVSEDGGTVEVLLPSRP